ncbi:non-hydrolyzing UDP-N-acetylglucosamine 2-epimerase [Phenylobacterium sp.]|uniref:non-hydrolyzing UDP-N-acetylglucosamine 2-epimerase n=1 Tax=Phenylobacterium sp. TaxID=1871053 RepID=UPI002E35372F|nr:UDP-N-acetylglucosamine 2-epimerase (non-hydrolyzing) [Phenylobacterium sp.]HEX2560223.1 UDP-N-acetylglucosamine 2-epimerase (non-hydrolyzing) [Phenylobacterium sp.]
MKALVVLGTRPEAIKLAPVILELRRQGAGQVVVCTTGQHREMVRPVLDLFGITPDFDLNLMRPNQSLNYLAGAVTSGVGQVIDEVRPSAVVVQGDTTTAFAAALSAFHAKVPVAHVEAGLRTGDVASPWPEEMNRILIARLADLHFPPTRLAYDNLRAEGVAADRILLSGNTVVDAALEVVRLTPAERTLELDRRFGLFDRNLPMVLFTMHRRESFGAPMKRTFEALAAFCRTHAVQVIFPVHPNPQVRQLAETILADVRGVQLVAPLEYDEMIHLLQRCRFVITDSGGLVEEAPTFRKPALVLRETTERTESIEAGCAVLCGVGKPTAWKLGAELLADGELFAKMSLDTRPYGDGRAAERIAARLLSRRNRSARAA